MFIDGCFWHGCPKCAFVVQRNAAYWTAKIARNQRRDRAAQGVVAEARKRSAPVVKNAVDEAKAHPIATAATLAMAAAAVAGLLLSHRKNAKA